MTQCEWLELGFFYERDDDLKEWRLRGLKAGLRQLAEAIRAYAANPRNRIVSEHEHFGPYKYLEIGTCPTTEITDHWIAGPISEIYQLAQLMEARLDKVLVGDCVFLRSEFAPSSPYEFILEIEGDNFDPSTADLDSWP